MTHRAGRQRRPSAALIAILVAAGIAAAGCSGAASPSPTAGPSAEPTQSRAPATPTEAAPADSGSHETPPTPTDTPFIQPTPPPDPFGRREEPPPGVEPTLFFNIPNLRPCRNRPDQAGPEVRVEVPELWIPQRKRICLLGFAPNEPIEVVAVGPDGARLADAPVTDADGVAEWWITRIPGDPEGTYEIDVAQGDRQATGIVEVLRATMPGSLAIPQVVELGDRVTIWFGGLEPSSSTPAYLYVLDDTLTWRFATTLPPIAVDERGHGSLWFQTSESDPAGRYRVESVTSVELRLIPRPD